MKKIVYLLVCFLLCIGIGGSAFILYKNLGLTTPACKYRS